LNFEEFRGTALCRLEEIADPGSKGFAVEGRELFVVRHGETIVAYRNIGSRGASSICPSSTSSAPPTAPSSASKTATASRGLARART